MKINAKEYLRNIQSLNTRITMKQKQLDEIKDSLTNIRSSADVELDWVQTSRGTTSSVEALVVKLDDLAGEINRDIDYYIDQKNEAVKLVDQLGNKTYIEILSMRYFEGKSWEEIAVSLDYSYRYTTKLHGLALVDFQKILDKEKASLMG